MDTTAITTRARSARIHYEVRTRNEYFDLEPHLKRYRRTESRA